jgi:predicted Zn finger-like uncharacterized protein
MADEVRCPECNARVSVPDGAAGKRLRCRKCDHVFRAGTADVDVVADETPGRRPPRRDDDRPRRPRDDDEKPRSRRRAVEEDEEDEDDDEDERPARKKGKKARKKSSLPFLLGVVAALVLAVGAIGVVVAWSQGMFGGPGADPFADAEKPVERTIAREPEDFSEHVVIRFAGLDEWPGGRLYPKIEYESKHPGPTAAQFYVLVYRQPRGEYTSPLKLDASRRLKGSLTVPYVRDPEMTVYVARKRITGKTEELVRVSNIIQFPDALKKP